MFFHRCAICGCALDPGEGRVCDECILAGERKKARDAAMELLSDACMEQGFTQMEMEDYFNEEGNYKNAC